jgi:hypothetical protein
MSGLVVCQPAWQQKAYPEAGVGSGEPTYNIGFG